MNRRIRPRTLSYCRSPRGARSAAGNRVSPHSGLEPAELRQGQDQPYRDPSDSSTPGRDPQQPGISFDVFYYCLHHPGGVIPEYSGRYECRKPSPYFLLQAKTRFDLDLANSWMIGDTEIDILCGRAAGVRTIRVAADHRVPEPSPPTVADRTARDLADAARWLAAAA